ncbi:hypothetical protein C3744_13160 [Priestia megaterium]|uniref:Uncharacterized protein n=1 Tax=Priestia megaterium TaxID=1404 RepID=A0A3D8X2X5_PRIMG|nr:hypothetical protein C3744_13160 [Priestia megaterium]
MFIYHKKEIETQLNQSNQQLETPTYMKPTFTLTIKKSERVGFLNKNPTRSDLSSTKILLSQPL